MGTSASSGGLGGKTPLVPSWLEGSPQPVVPAQPAFPAGAMPLPGALPPVPHEPLTGVPPGGAMPQNIRDEARFQKARLNFTKFASDRGRPGRRALGRAIRSYVTRGNGGAAKASRRMGSSRRAAANLIDVLARIQRDGVDKAFRDLDIDLAFTGTVEDAFLALTDVICEDGGPVDEGIARDAWCEVVAALDTLGITDLAAMTDSQRRALFAAFVAETIKLRIQNDIGARGFKIAGTAVEVREVAKELFSYVRAATGDEVARRFPGNLVAVTTPQLRSIGDTVYEVAWALLETYRAP